MKNHSFLFLALMDLSLAISPLAWGATIPGLFSTGVDSLGNPLVGGLWRIRPILHRHVRAGWEYLSRCGGHIPQLQLPC